MTPSLVLALVLASLYGLVFYLLFGHGWLRLVFYWLVSVAGFFLGQWIARAVGLALFNIGDLNVVEGTLVSWLSLSAVHAWRRVR
jgi:hypothetical protein